MNENDNINEEIKKSVETIIGTNTVFKKKRKNPIDLERENFELLIKVLDDINNRDIIIGGLGLDLSSYTESFYKAIDALIIMKYGLEASQIIFFYLYERINEDGSINELIDQETQEVVILNNPLDLWYLILKIRSKMEKGKRNESKNIK